jgi:hypothetical protein
MRKQSRILKHVADAAPMRRDVDARAAVIEHVTIHGDDAAIRLHEAGNHADQRGLART